MLFNIPPEGLPDYCPKCGRPTRYVQTCTLRNSHYLWLACSGRVPARIANWFGLEHFAILVGEFNDAVKYDPFTGEEVKR